MIRTVDLMSERYGLIGEVIHVIGCIECCEEG